MSTELIKPSSNVRESTAIVTVHSVANDLRDTTILVSETSDEPKLYETRLSVVGRVGSVNRQFRTLNEVAVYIASAIQLHLKGEDDDQRD